MSEQSMREALEKIKKIIDDHERILQLPDVKTVKQIWNIALDALAVPAPQPESAEVAEVQEALEEAKLFLESIMLGYQRTRNYAQAAEWQSVINKVERALAVLHAGNGNKPVVLENG